MLIEKTEQLAALCARLKKKKFITIDTEFMRDFSYYPSLCLIQVASEDEAWCIDPLSPDLNLKPLLDVMKDTKVLKVFHGARQDLEIFFELMHDVPRPLFDTQIGAMVCGMGNTASYQSLVSQFLGLTLDKSNRFTDWSHRPLTESQITYALSDVTHLIDVYKQMMAHLKKIKRESWLAEDMAQLADPKNYIIDVEDAWVKLRKVSHSPRFSAVLRELAMWREQEAMAQNKPRRHILRDELLYELAASRPASLEDLKDTRTFGKKQLKHYGKEVIEAVARGMKCPENKCPVVPKKTPLSEGGRGVVKILDLLLTVVCANEKVASRLVALPEDIEAIVNSDKADVPAMKGWRYEIFGRQAIAFKKGKLGMRFIPKTKRVEFFDL